MFDYDLLVKLVNIAKGDRGLNEFARGCGIEPSVISRLLNKKINNPPNPKYLLKIADNSELRISYNELLGACGYMDSKTKYNNHDLNQEIKELEAKLNRIICIVDQDFSKGSFDNIMGILNKGMGNMILLSRSRNEIA